MKLLVTGGSGLVGRYVVDVLARAHTVEVVDIKPLHRPDIALHTIDVLDLKALSAVVTSFDAVVHLAGIPNPLNEPAEKVFRVNTLGTYNVLEACAINGIGKIVFMSSESTLGFAFSSSRMWPQYIPVDELHPLRPQDPYGLSKVAGELLCAGYARKTGMQAICLRAPWIWVPEEKSFYKQLIAEYPKWYKSLWAFIHVDDVAQAVQSVVEAETPPAHEVYFVSADENWTGKESRALLREFFPETTTFAKDFRGDQSLISCTKAKRAFGFSPRYTARDIFLE
ncbi:MAG: NAD-dependent epimerase/dehydratase family protein [Bacteroidota bacterium]